MSEPKIMSVSELFKAADAEMAKLRELCKTDKLGITLRGGYFIEWDRINSKPKLLQWVHHLTEKRWFKTELCHYFISVVAKHFGWEIYDDEA